MEERSDLPCPKCGSALAPETQGCSNCGYTLSGARVYNPAQFIALSLVLSAMVPIYMAASNWGTIGNKRAKAVWLVGGFVSFALLFSFLILLSPGSDPVAKGFPLYLLNLPVGYVLRDMQEPLYDAAVRLGARRASTFKGCMLGLCLALCALAVPIGCLMAVTEAQFRRGLTLLKQKKHEEAAAVFQGILRWVPEEKDAVFNLALCNVLLRRWDEAAKGFESYLQKEKGNAAAYALLAHVRWKQGRFAEANELTSKARTLEPGVIERLFGPSAPPGSVPGSAPQEPGSKRNR